MTRRFWALIALVLIVMAVSAVSAADIKGRTSVGFKAGFFMPVHAGSEFTALPPYHQTFMRGSNLSLELKHAVSNRMLFGLSLGHISTYDDTLGLNGRGDVRAKKDSATTSCKLTGTSLGINVQYLLHRGRLFQPYLVAGMGLDFWRVRAFTDSIVPPSGDTIGTTAHVATDLHLKIGPGIKIPLSDYFSIDAQFVYKHGMTNVHTGLPEKFYGPGNWSKFSQRSFHGYWEPTIGLTCLFGDGSGGGAKANQFPKTARGNFDLGKDRYDHKRYLSAIEHFQQVVYNYPGDPIVDTAQFYLALSYYANKDYALAMVEFNRLITNYPASPYAVQSQFMRAACTFENTPKSSGLDQTELDEAIRQLEDFILEHPESEQIPDANKLLDAARGRLAKKYYDAATVYTRLGTSAAAKVYYQKVIDDYTNSEYAPLATFRMAQEDMSLKSYDEARRRFDNFCVVYSGHPFVPRAKKLAAQAAFKAGVSSFEKGEFQAAKDKFTAFKKDFPEDDQVKKAEKYIAEADAKLASTPTPTDAKP